MPDNAKAGPKRGLLSYLPAAAQTVIVSPAAK